MLHLLHFVHLNGASFQLKTMHLGAVSAVSAAYFY